jgi:hypothetical protein
MRKFGAVLAAGIMAMAMAGAAPAAATHSMNSMHSMNSADHMMMSGKMVTLTGNVVDLSCYNSMGLHGKSHVACAKACNLKGQPFGLELSDGKIITFYGNGPNDNPNAKILPFVEQKVTITGTEFTNHGMTGVHVVTIIAAK